MPPVSKLQACNQLSQHLRARLEPIAHSIDFLLGPVKLNGVFIKNVRRLFFS